jgi:hypothetical protein
VTLPTMPVHKLPVQTMPDLSWLGDAVVRLLLWVEPSGGQAVARRNAWAGLVEDGRRRAQRLEAERSFAPASARPPVLAMAAVS